MVCTSFNSSCLICRDRWRNSSRTSMLASASSCSALCFLSASKIRRESNSFTDTSPWRTRGCVCVTQEVDERSTGKLQVISCVESTVCVPRQFGRQLLAQLNLVVNNFFSNVEVRNCTYLLQCHPNVLRWWGIRNKLGGWSFLKEL